jgi:spore maturation protein CgeB
MLSEYSDDLNSMFQEGKEAEYFRNKEEMLEKIKYYLIHDKEREKIAEAGYKRLLKDGCEALDRVKEIIRVFESYKNKKL